MLTMERRVNVREVNGKTIAQCPACAEQDRNGK